MTRTMCILLVVMVSGCESTETVHEEPMQVTYGTLISGEEPVPTQEELGRTIVMVARGWERWPKGKGGGG